MPVNRGNEARVYGEKSSHCISQLSLGNPDRPNFRTSQSHASLLVEGYGQGRATCFTHFRDRTLIAKLPQPVQPGLLSRALLGGLTAASLITHHRPRCLARRIRTTTAAGLVLLLVVTSLPACATLVPRASMRPVTAGAQPVAARSLSDWSRVEAVPVGTPIEVQLHEDEAPRRGSRKIQGRFHSATADTLRLTLDEWSTPTYTLAKSAVHIVHTRRPIGKRYAGWLSWLGTTLVLVSQRPGDWDLSFHVLVSTLIGGAASLPGFLIQRMQRIYEATPEASRLITQVNVPITDGDVVPRSREVAVSVPHVSRASRPPNETIGITVCLSLHPARCTGRWVVFEGEVRNLSSPVTATLGFGDETVPVDTPVPIYVHVVLATGPSWRPAPDLAVPQLGDPGVLDVETVTRRITVVDR